MTFVTYDPADWYWVVAGSDSQVWSSARVAYVAADDATYRAWQDAGNQATAVPDEATLRAVLTDQYPAGWPPTPAQHAEALLAGGLAITSTGTPALNATYACDAATQSYIQSEILAILVNNTFADGTTTLSWPDIHGSLHTFPSVATFRSFALATAAFVANCVKVIQGTTNTLPTAAATIP